MSEILQDHKISNSSYVLLIKFDENHFIVLKKLINSIQQEQNITEVKEFEDFESASNYTRYIKTKFISFLHSDISKLYSEKAEILKQIYIGSENSSASHDKEYQLLDVLEEKIRLQSNLLLELNTDEPNQVAKVELSAEPSSSVTEDTFKLNHEIHAESFSNGDKSLENLVQNKIEIQNGAFENLHDNEPKTTDKKELEEMISVIFNNNNLEENDYFSIRSELSEN
jgi:hypothetical protein